MKTREIAATHLVTSRLAYGTCRVTQARHVDELTCDQLEHGAAVCVSAYEAGYRLFDTADLYGNGACEAILGQALRQVRGFRDDVLIATKCGIRTEEPCRYDFSEGHILKSCDGSLKRLGIETIDIYQLHRPDPLGDPHEVAWAFDKLKQQGKVRYFGVSNFVPSQVAMLQRWLNVPIVVNQVEIHLLRLACIENGTLDQCLELQITPLAWSPVARGLLAEVAAAQDDHPNKAKLDELHRKLDEFAAEFGVTRTAIALAWLLNHPSGIIPIVGSANPDHIRDAARADDVELSREQWYDLYTIARGERLP